MVDAIKRSYVYVLALCTAFAVSLVLAMGAEAQDLGQIAQDKATQAVTAGAIVAGIILGAVILYRVIKRFSS